MNETLEFLKENVRGDAFMHLSYIFELTQTGELSKIEATHFIQRFLFAKDDSKEVEVVNSAIDYINSLEV